MTGSEILLPLGCEQYDGRLWRISPSPVVALTSADGLDAPSVSAPSQAVPPSPVHKPVHTYRPLTCVFTPWELADDTPGHSLLPYVRLDLATDGRPTLALDPLDSVARQSGSQVAQRPRTGLLQQ